MHKVQCEGCKQEVEVALYFYETRINTYESHVSDKAPSYEAFVRGRAICPCCGTEINKLFIRSITGKSIVNLAVGN